MSHHQNDAGRLAPQLLHCDRMTPSQRHYPSTDHLSVITAVTLLGYTVIRLLKLPILQIETTWRGEPALWEIPGSVFILLLVGLLVAFGTDGLFRSHAYYPVEDTTWQTWIHWILPTATALLLGLWLNQIDIATGWITGLVVSVIGLLGVLLIEYLTVSETARPVDRLIYEAVAYLVLIVGAIQLSNVLMLWRVLWMFVLASLVTLRLLRNVSLEIQDKRWIALGLGLTMAFASWALAYWSQTGLTRGLILLAIYYPALGLLKRGIKEVPERNVLIEYGAVGAVTLVLALLM